MDLVHRLTNMSAANSSVLAALPSLVFVVTIRNNLNILLHFVRIISFKMSRKQNTESSGTNEKHRSQLNSIKMEIIRQVKGKRICSLSWMLTGHGQLYSQL